MSGYPEKMCRIQETLSELSGLEKEGETDVDLVAGCSGRIMEEVLAFREDMWESSLRRMGFYLGKFIYILDAYDDVEKDAENGNYNPFLKKYKMEGFEEEIRRMEISSEIFYIPACGAVLRQSDRSARENGRKKNNVRSIQCAGSSQKRI